MTLGTVETLRRSAIGERDAVSRRGDGANDPVPLFIMAGSSAKLSGDTKILKQLDRALVHAAKQTVIAVLQESQVAVQATIKSTFIVRGTWFLPSNRFGIHIRYSRDRNDASGRLETPADWLEEHETGDDRTPDKHDGHLTIPQVGAARPTIGSVVPAALKARRILPNASLLESRALIRTSGRPGTSQGKRFTYKQTPFFLNRKGTAIFERLPGNQLKLFYTLTRKSKIKQRSTVIEPTINTVMLRFGPIYNVKLAETIAFRRNR